MTWRKRIVPVAIAVSLGAGGLTLPSAMAASSTHWTSAKCTSYVKRFKKKHKHATKAQIKAANKVLKKHGCSTKA